MTESPTRTGKRMLKVIDQRKCIGCHACTTACKSENDVPLSVTRTYVKHVDVGEFPTTRRAFQVTRCNQCEDAPCVTACPTAAMHQRADGIVDFDKSSCIGCKACIAACPYDAIFINPEDHCAEKCNFCAHRLDVGLEPACVSVCPTGALLVGDADDPTSEVARLIAREPSAVRRPEKGTRPKVHYLGATQATLDPLAAAAPDGDGYIWAEKPTGAHIVSGGHPGKPSSSAAAVLSYDVAHRAPWDFRVSLYTWTKSLAAGAYLVAVLMAVLGRVSWESTFMTWTSPITATVALAITAGVLIWDLDHPERFLYILTKPQWRSWLVRGGVILTGFAAALGLHLMSSLISAPGMAKAVAWLGVPLALGTAIYTAFLFAQARARDLWQSPLLAPHLVVQAALAGAAILLMLSAFGGVDTGLRLTLAWTLAAAAATHLILVASEVSVGHPTEHARLAAHEMTGGRYKSYFWAGVILVALGLTAPWLGPAAAVVSLAALLGLLAHEHSYIQAGQSVPLA